MSDARLDVRKTYKLLINGAYPRSESGRSYEVTSAKGAFLATSAQGSRKDVRGRGQRSARSASEMVERDRLQSGVRSSTVSPRWPNHVATNSRAPSRSRGRERQDESKESLGVDRSHRLVRRVDRQGCAGMGGPIPWPARSSTSRSRCRAAWSVSWVSKSRSKDSLRPSWRHCASAIRSSPSPVKPVRRRRCCWAR